ncbi:hypothetical protein ABZS68_37770 [Streptomyces sp. NPDC005571]|uniref:hypothetical protein n=1 Tax=unclassified Streptomyces TaxID=2593676 RepID=UPI0033A10101
MATATKTKSPTLAELEADHLKAAKAQTAELARLAEQVEDFQIEAEQASAKLNRMRRTFGQGDATATAEEFAAAFHGVERAELLATGVTRKVAELRKKPPVTDKRVAELAARLVNMNHVSEVTPTFVKPPVPADLAKPVIYVVQTSPTVDRGGQLSADVEFVQYRPEGFIALDANAINEIRQAVHREGWSIRDIDGSSHYGMDTVRAKGLHVREGIPVITKEPGEVEVRAAASIAGGYISSSMRVGGALGDKSALRMTPTKKRYKATTGEDGIRRTVIEVEYDVQSKVVSTESGLLYQAMHDGVPAMVGAFVQGVGVIEEAEQVHAIANQGADFRATGGALSLRLVIVSAVRLVNSGPAPKHVPGMRGAVNVVGGRGVDSSRIVSGGGTSGVIN